MNAIGRLRGAVGAIGAITKLRGRKSPTDEEEEDQTEAESKEEAEIESDTLMASSARSAKRPIFAIANGYSDYHVRLKDVKELVARRAMKRRRRLGFLLEAVYLFFFIPFCIYWMATLGQLKGTAALLTSEPFPANPVPPTENLREAEFINFDGIISEEEFWQWVNNVLYDQVFIKGQCGVTVGGDPNILITGLIRLRQLRVSPETCPKTASQLGITCYPSFSSKSESSEPISSDFPYHTKEATGESSYYGEMAIYPGSGFTLDLETGSPLGSACNISALNQTVELLRARATPFLDASSRAVITTITTYNPNSGALVTTHLAVEMSYSGAFQTTHESYGVIFYRDSSSQLRMQVLTIFVTVIEGIFILCMLYMVLIASRNLDSIVWIALDVVTCALMIVQLVIILQFFFTSNYTSHFEDSIVDPTDGLWSGAGFYTGSDLQQLTKVTPINGTLLLLSAARLFKYSQYFDSMEVIHGTFRRTFNDICLYLFLLFLLSLGYVLCGVVVLGNDLYQYRNYGNAVYTLLQYYILTIDYYSVARVKPFGMYFAPIFLASFLLIFTWYMFSVFVAIIYVGFRLERAMLRKQRKEKHKWIREAERFGALCPVQEDILRGNIVLEDDDDEQETLPIVGNRLAEASSKPGGAGDRFGWILLRKNFYFRKWSERASEFLRSAIGLPERRNFLDYDTMLIQLEDYEDRVKKSLATPSKRFFLSFGDLLQIFNNRSLDLLEELRRLQTDSLVDDKHRRSRRGDIISDAERQQYLEDMELHTRSDTYLKLMDPLELQLTRIFRELWIIAPDKVDALARHEADDSGGLIKRSMLGRIQQTLEKMDERDTEASRLIINKLKSMRVVQQTMERDIRTMREILK